MNSLTTPRLLLQYQEAVAGVDAGLITRREFREFVRGLRQEQERLNRKAAAARARREAIAEAERQRRIAEELRQAEERERVRRARKAEKARARRARAKEARNLLFRGEAGAEVTQFLKDAYARTAGVPLFRIKSAATTGVTRDIEINRPKDAESFAKLFFVYSDGTYTEYMDEGGTLEIYRPTLIRGRPMRRQLFRDGISHCVFTPLVSKLEAALETTTSKERRVRLKQKISKLGEMGREFEEGVPVEQMEAVAKASGFKIIIHDILGRELYTFNEAGKCGVVRFTNTRPNHVDEGRIVLDCDPVHISQEAMAKKWLELRKSREFYMIEGDLKNNLPRRIRTIEGVYQVFDPNREYYDEMDKRVGVAMCRLNATQHPDVNEFVKAGRIINSWVTPFSDEKPTGHIDMPKAYTQFKKCAWYAGFLGVIHQWRSGLFDREFIEKHVGIYRVQMKCSNPLFNKLGIGRAGFFGGESTTHILPSPEILYFMDNGVECIIDAGVWGSRMDFEFPDEMLQDRRYAIWSGRLSMEYESKKYSFSCSQDWAEHIKADYGDDCFYWEDKKLCSVRIPNKNVHTTHHILAFITSYVRIQMIEALKQFDLGQIVKVVMDGIYYKGDKPDCLDWFRPKDIVEHRYSGFAWYSDVSLSVDWSACWIGGNALMTGQGGAGKTHKVMTDGCFNRILFVTPQHILGGDVSKKFGVPYTTIHKLIGEGCESWLTSHAYPAVLFIDEITQIPAEWIDRVFAMYKHSLIVLAGDLDSRQWFQCRNGKPGEFSKIWKPSGVEVFEVVGDRRSRDDELRALKLVVRSRMREVFIDGDSCEVNRMKMWAYRTLNLTKFSDAVGMFSPGDVWIAGTHKTSEKLLANGVVSGWYKQGGFVAFEEKEGYEKRGSFTIHSFQGRTLETGKIFISIDDVFEYAMLYTAISRAVNFSQLVFVRND